MPKTAGYKELMAAIPAPVGGINMAAAVHDLKPNEAVEIRGFEFIEDGVIGIPWGDVSLGNITGVGGVNVQSGHIFQRESGGTQMIVHLNDGSIRYSTNFLTAGVGGATWTVIASGLSPNQPFAYATYLDEVFMTNGVDDYRKWDGTTQTTYPAVPKMKYLAVWKDVMWGAGETANPHRVRQSDPGDASSWPALGFVDLEKGREFGISGIVGVVNELVVFKLKRTLGIYDPVELTNRLVDADKGCISHFSIVSHQGQLFFVSHLGVCAYLGDAPSQIVSQNIAPIFKHAFFDFAAYTQVRDYTSEARIWACSFEDRIDFRFPMNPGQALESFSFYPSMENKPWLRSGFQGGVGLSVREKGAPEEQYEVNGDEVFRRYDADHTQGSTTCIWLSAWYDFDAPTYEKYLYLAQVFNRGPITMTINRDYDMDISGNPYNVTDGAGEPVIGASSQELVDHTVYLDSYGRCFQIRMEISAAAHLFNRVSSGLGTTTKVGRFACGIGRVLLRARQLSEGYR